MLIFLILLCLSCLVGSRYTRGNTFLAEPLSKDHVTSLRGILAIEIVLGHTYMQWPETELLYYNNRIGVWVVGIFFFLSGYGLSYSLNKKENYLENFVIKKLWHILLPMVFIYIIWFIQDWTRNPVRFVWQDWFVTEILFLYILWYIVNCFMNEKGAIILLAICVLLLNILGTYYQIGTRWYGSTACFLLGEIVYKYEKKYNQYLEQNYIKVCIGSMLFFAMLVLFFMRTEEELPILALTVIINISCLLICQLVYLFYMKVHVGNLFTKFAGLISWEIYITHRTMIRMVKGLQIENTFANMCILFGGVLLMASCLHWICELGGKYEKKNVDNN